MMIFLCFLSVFFLRIAFSFENSCSKTGTIKFNLMNLIITFWIGLGDIFYQLERTDEDEESSDMMH